MFKIEFESKNDCMNFCGKKGIKIDQIREYKKDEVISFSSRIKNRESQILSNVPLVEWAEWGDVEYGCVRVCEGGEETLMGQNGCGRIMMKVRKDMRDMGY